MIKKILFVIGIILLAINIYGLFRTLRNPALYDEETIIRNRVEDVTLKYPSIKEQLQKLPGESNKDFAIRVNSVVNKGMAHYWRDEGLQKYNLRVPVWENYLLHLASYIKPKEYKKYEFSNYEKNLERGVGLCSAHSIVVNGVLKEHGIKGELLTVGGRHVVTRAEIDDSTAFILDPDYGIVVPYDTAAISANPELVRASYREMAALYYPDAKDPYTTDFMVEIFGGKKYVYTVNNWFEYFSYWAIWIIPLLLMFPFVINFLRRKTAQV